MVALAFVFTSCLAIWALAYPLPRSGLAPAAVTPDASILGYSSISSGAVQVEAPSALTGTVSPRALLPKIFKKLSAAKTSPKPQSQRVQKPPPVAQRPAQPPVQPLRSTDDPTPPQSSPDAKAKIADLAADFLKDNGGALCNNLLDGACQDKTDQGSQYVGLEASGQIIHTFVVLFLQKLRRSCEHWGATQCCRKPYNAVMRHRKPCGVRQRHRIPCGATQRPCKPCGVAQRCLT
ncbi:hypothetical protein HGRIS_013400 [Hohenbuehelia grisea]|uniref:Uncharacterized protein n=1 Tax=Hohenbuehelia grisea TaxID=104357 RepID=A0ABR3IVJ8_9AGAR